MSQYPTADAAEAWLKSQQPHVADGDTQPLRRPRPSLIIPVRRIVPTPRPSLVPLFVWIGLVGMLGGMAAPRMPVLAFAWVALVVAFVWKLER